MRTLRPALVLTALVLVACQSDGPLSAPASLGTPRAGLLVVNEEATLAARVRDAGGAPIGVVSDEPAMMASMIGDGAELPFKFQQEVDAPTVGGEVLPATHIVFDGMRAYVSYAPAGERLLGAVDVFDISHSSQPKLISSARFTDTKILTMAIAKDRLLLGTASGSADFADTPAVVEEIALDRHGRLTEKSRRVAVSSFVVTGIVVTERRIWVGSGTSEKEPGGLTILDERHLRIESEEPLADVRAISVNGGVVTVLQGGGARMRLYDARKTGFIREFSIGGLTAAGHKATIANTGNWAFVAAGDSGVVFTRIRQNGSTTGTKLFSWGTPAGIAGVADEDAVTNAVTVSGSYAYAANGGAGVWVARGNWSSTAQNHLPSITPIGRLDLPGISANMVGVSGGSLFVAAGLGGLKILQQPTP